MKILLLILTIIYYSLCSCSKTTIDADQQQTGENEVRPYHSTIVDCVCDYNKENDFKFTATINNKSICLSNDFKQTLFNNHWRRSSWQNEIFMLKRDADSSIGIGITYKNPIFYKQSLPYKIDKDNVDFCEVITVSIMNFKYAKFCGCPTDDSLYESATSYDNLTVNIISFKDSILEGTYAGDFRNRGGRKFNVTNGYFKTKLKTQN